MRTYINKIPKPKSNYVEKMLNQNKVKETKQTLIEITVIGKDRKGVVAEITNFIFKNYGISKK